MVTVSGERFAFVSLVRLIEFKEVGDQLSSSRRK